MAEKTSMQKTIKVPERLKGKTIWTVPPKDIKQDVPGRFEIDKCSQKELEYLESIERLKE